MALTFQFQRDLLSFITVEDVEFAVGAQTLDEAFHQAKNKGNEQPWHLLFDIRHSKENRSTAELNYMADVIGKHRALLTGKCAIVADQPLHYGLSRMFAAFLLKYEIRTEIIPDRDAAEAWLYSTQSS
ncbi:MAG TPA: hypothetical protein PKA06_09135 [Gemmatales bacterium]|nr:hypothetical protein [Gemmatales bacterium]